MKTIKDYIQFWIENWYCKKSVTNTIELITSRPFIEAIGKWLWKKIKKEQLKKGDTIFNTYDKFELIHRKMENMKRGMIREITTRQAIAIRDWELETFITNLLTK